MEKTQEAIDRTYRVTLMCKCNADLVWGVGATAELAKAEAYRHWRKHGRAKPKEEITERLTSVPANGGGTYERYEEVSA